MKLSVIAGLLQLTAVTSAHGSEIKRLIGQLSPPIIMITGPIVSGDGDRFAATAEGETFAVVTLGSPGGNLLEGLRIGQMIRTRKFATLVPSGVSCTSACAFAWLGGVTRFMQPDARIGFHAAYILEDGKPVESGVGNALAGAYMAQLGLGYAAIFYIEHSHPDDITWLTQSDAKSVGIAVTVLPSVSISRWFMGNHVQRPAMAGPPPRAIQDVALNFPASYFARWSDSSADIMQFFSTVYDKKVNFYGSEVDRAVVLAAKRNFARRWPTRVYAVRPGSVVADCKFAICKLTGLVDWDARSSTGSERTAGSANFTFRVRVLGEIAIIVAESGSILAHNNSKP